ncbi:MAG TPA: hypothetical protein VNO31_08345 [Umezawaea sp.]|nr:hypothetical protein [Umezawaea sp.]
MYSRSAKVAAELHEKLSAGNSVETSSPDARRPHESGNRTR